MSPEQRLADLTAELVRGIGGTISLDAARIGCSSRATRPRRSVWRSRRLLRGRRGRARGGRAPHERRADAVPEETNRRLVAPLATLHFCPTPGNAENLLAEGVPGNRVLVTGNTVIDALLWAVERARLLGRRCCPAPRRRILLTLHRRESHGEAMRRVCRAVRRLAGRGDVELVFPVHRSPAVRRVVVPELGGSGGSASHRSARLPPTVHMLDSCQLVLSDSGGLQEEAPALGKPVLVLRRLHGAAGGGGGGECAPRRDGRGRDRRGGHRAARRCGRVRGDGPSREPFGDGQASERVVAALEQRVSRTAGSMSSAPTQRRKGTVGHGWMPGRRCGRDRRFVLCPSAVSSSPEARTRAPATRAKYAPAAPAAIPTAATWPAESSPRVRTLVLYDTGGVGLARRGVRHADRESRQPLRALGREAGTLDTGAGTSTRYSALVYLGSTYDERLPRAQCSTTSWASRKPVMWVADNILQLARRAADFARSTAGSRCSSTALASPRCVTREVAHALVAPGRRGSCSAASADPQRADMSRRRSEGRRLGLPMGRSAREISRTSQSSRSRTRARPIACSSSPTSCSTCSPRRR